MLIESQANRNEIEMLNLENEAKQDKMEKLNLEVTVVITEKLTLKKELDQLTISHRTLNTKYKEQRADYDLLADETIKVKKQNSEYRGLILNNESKLQMI